MGSRTTLFSEIWMFEELGKLSEKEEELLIKFWQAWSDVRDTTGHGEVRATMQMRKWKHLFKTTSDTSTSSGTVWKKHLDKA